MPAFCRWFRHSAIFAFVLTLCALSQSRAEVGVEQFTIDRGTTARSLSPQFRAPPGAQELAVGGEGLLPGADPAAEMLSGGMPVDPRPPTTRGRGHLQIWDFLAGAAAAGATWGVAESYCTQSGFNGSWIWAGPVIMAVATIPVADGPNPYRDRHPPTPYSAGKESWYPQMVEVMTRDGEWMAGFVNIRKSILTVKGKHGRRQVPLDSVVVIDIPDDRSRWWDRAVEYGLLGAVWGLIAANNASLESDPVQKAPPGPMAAWGAGICGGTALLLDLMHTGRSRVYDARGTVAAPAPTSLRISPHATPHGGGVTLTFRF